LISPGAEPAGNSPAEFGAYFHPEIKKWGNVIKAAGIKLEP
jgi:tripartite-type tricarboxylate transporter receptor subunit TctC